MTEADITNKQMLEKLMQAIESIKEEGLKNKEELKQEIKSENEKLLKKLEEHAGKITYLSEKYDQLEIRCTNLERGYRKNNIIIFGLEVPNASSLVNYTLGKLNELLGIQLQDSDINNIYQLKSDRIPPIKIEFLSYLKKDLVVKNRTKLKGTNIFIAHDLTYEERQEQKILTKHLKLARSKNYLAKIKGKVLHVNDEIYTLEQLREIEARKEENTEEDIVEKILPNSEPSTPSTSIINLTQIFDIPKKSEAKQTEKRANSSPADPVKEKENKKIHRTFSNSSAKSDKSDRVTRNKITKPIIKN